MATCETNHNPQNIFYPTEGSHLPCLQYLAVDSCLAGCSLADVLLIYAASIVALTIRQGH